MLSCHPYRINNQRILVYAKRLPSEQTQTSFLEKYQQLVASTSNLPSSHLLQENDTEFTIKSIMTIVFKFLDPTIEREVRHELLFNRIIIATCFIAILVAFGMLIKSRHVEKKQ